MLSSVASLAGVGLAMLMLRAFEHVLKAHSSTSTRRAEMRRLLNRKIVEQNQQCAICQVAFTNYNDIVPDHIDPRGMGGSRRDDHPENIQAVHFGVRPQL
jgi:hypothetical protein